MIIFRSKCWYVALSILALLLVLFQPGCTTAKQVQPDHTIENYDHHLLLAKKTDESSYEEMGRLWGERIKEWKQSHRDEQAINKDLILFLLTRDPRGLTVPGIAQKTDFYGEGFAQEVYQMIMKSPEVRPSYYFQIHMSLKRAFQRGFQAGFVNRNADMVLGPHITEAARVLATVNAYRFMFNVRDYAVTQDSLAQRLVATIEDAKVALTTKEQLDATIESSVEIFKELIAEGSPADRKAFQEEFKAKYKSVSQSYMARPPESVEEYIVEASGTLLKHNFKKVHSESHNDPNIFKIDDQAVYTANLQLVDAEDMWVYVYRRSVTEVGIEMGTKSSHNLIVREDLIDWLRRALIALDDYEDQEEWIRKGFLQAYGNENMGKEVFDNLLRDTGLHFKGN